jgi:hypothetical protein
MLSEKIVYVGNKMLSTLSEMLNENGVNILKMLNELLILRYYSWADSFGGPLFTPPIVRA